MRQSERVRMKERERERVRVQDTTLYWNGRVPRLQLVLKLFAPFSHHQCRLIALRMCDNYLSLRTDYEEWDPSIESKTKTKDLQLNSSSHLNAWVKRCVKKAQPVLPLFGSALIIARQMTYELPHLLLFSFLLFCLFWQSFRALSQSLEMFTHSPFVS